MSPPHWLGVYPSLYVRRIVASNSFKIQSGGATIHRLYETAYLMYDRTYDKTKSLHRMWNPLSENIRHWTKFHYTPMHIMNLLLLIPWIFFTLWINRLQQWTSSIPSTKSFICDRLILHWTAHIPNHQLTILKYELLALINNEISQTIHQHSVQNAS